MAVSQSPPDDNERDSGGDHPRLGQRPPGCGLRMLTEDLRDGVEAVIYDPENEDAWIESSRMVSWGEVR